MIRTIPLQKLIVSPRNVRRSCDERADLGLKADIAAHGLLQNLVVAPAKKPRGTFTVEAGGRRLRALQALVEDEMLDAGHEVPCLVIDGGSEARELGLAENIQRLAMNPADECLAFGQLVEQGLAVEDVARRFGLTVRFVEGRLRLSGLAPEIFAALGTGDISLDVAKAYAATADRERQAWVFEQLHGSYSGNHPDSIRRMMTQASASASDRRALLVGEDAYVAAGGRIERDLFSDDADARWLDVPLLEQLAGALVEARAAEVQAETGLAWVRPVLESWVGYSMTMGMQRVVPDRAPSTPEEAVRIAAAETAIAELLATFDEDVSEGAQAGAEEMVDSLRREIATLRDKPAIIEDELKAGLGAFLVLDDDGTCRLDPYFYRERAAEADTPDPEGGDDRAAADAGSEAVGRAGLPKPLPRTLVDELAIQRRDLLAVHVGADPQFAGDLALFLMIDREAGRSNERSGSSLLALAPSDPVNGFTTPGARAVVARDLAIEGLDRSWASGPTRAERFDLFRALPDDAKAAWLGHAVARTLEASANAPGERRCAFHDHLGQLLGIDVARWWRPTGANYFDRVPKAVTVAALQEVGGPAFAASYAGLKKAGLSQSAERIFSGDFVGEVEVKARATAWVPEPMRFAAPPLPETGVAPDTDQLPPWEEASRDTAPASIGICSPLAAAVGSGGGEDGPGACEAPAVEEAASLSTMPLRRAAFQQGRPPRARRGTATGICENRSEDASNGICRRVLLTAAIAAGLAPERIAARGPRRSSPVSLTREAHPARAVPDDPSPFIRRGR